MEDPRTQQEKERDTYISIMNLISHRVSAFLSMRKPGDTYVLALRPNDLGFGATGKVLRTLDPADAGSYKILQQMESQMQESMIESQQKGSA